jgi:hypothetical protein
MCARLMTVRRTVFVLAVLMTNLAGPARAQTREDSVAVTNAFVRAVLREKRSPGGWNDTGTVFVDSGSTAWGAYAARVLRAALPSSLMPRSDTARYYALRVTLQSLWISGDKAEVRAEWSNCRRPRAGEYMNWWANSTTYSLARTDTLWSAAEGHIRVYMDGHCDPYPGQP